MIDKASRAPFHPKEEITLGFHILNYNQGLVQFADSKAHALLLINSIFIASLGPFLEKLSTASPMPDRVKVVLAVFGVTAVVSIIASLAVFVTRNPPISAHRSNGLVYFGDILQKKNVDSYIHEVRHIECGQFQEQLLANAYDVSHIAARKFAIYGFGQLATLVSCASWIITILFCCFG